MMNFLLFSEDISTSVTGETPDGEQMVLENDVLIYFKLAAFEQGVLNRLRASKELTLRDEIDDKKGVVYLGDMEAVRNELIAQINKMFDAIKEHRNNEKPN